jgi:hypothetical protein
MANQRLTAGFGLGQGNEEIEKPSGKALSPNVAAGLAISAGLAGQAISSGSPTSSTSGAVGGALSGAGTGFALGTALGGPGVGSAIGAGLGAIQGISKAKSAKRRIAAQIESDRLQAESAIQGAKGQRIANALSGMRSAFSAALLQNRKLNLR